MIRPILAAVLFASAAGAQTIPIGLPMFPEPPEANGADPILYPNAILYNTGLQCLQSAIGSHWECMTKSSELDAVHAVATAAQTSATSAATAAANAQSTATSAQTAASSAASAASAAQSTANSASTAASNAQSAANAAQTTATNAGTAAATAQSTATAAQTSASSAASAASAAQTTANAAQSAASTNATAITALQTTVAAIPRRACNTASVTGLSIPLLGISTTSTVAVASAPAGTSCDVGVPSFLPLGAKAEAAVLTAGTVSLRFVSNTGLLSAIINIPNGTYRVCCDL